jgi:hypothetical protein
MCVLIYCPPGTGLPDESTLRDCWEMNPDGAGYAYSLGGLVVYSKGYMSIKKYLKALRKLSIPITSHLILHFRISTHGGKSPALTHPFPLMDEENIHALSGITESVIAHNGILDCPTYEGHSDTSSYVLTVAGERKVYASTGADGTAYLLDKACKGSKVVELTGYGPVFYGDKWSERGGRYFSNTYHEAHTAWGFQSKFDFETIPTSRWYDKSEACYFCGGEIPMARLDDVKCPHCGEVLQFN